MKTAIFAFVLSATLANAGVAPVQHGPCHVIANNATSDWLPEQEAIEYAKGWTMLGLEAKVICRPAKPDTLEWALLGADATMRALDAYSTRRALEGPNKENTLPMSIAGNTGTMWAYSMGIVAFDWFLVRELDRKHHRRLAKAVYLADIGIEGSTLRNFTLKGRNDQHALTLQHRPILRLHNNMQYQRTSGFGPDWHGAYE